jgi:hypothetical protein
MIRRERSKFTLTCDGCGLVIQDQGYRPNNAAWAQAQREGWTSRPINDGKDWQHFCSGCPQQESAA